VTRPIRDRFGTSSARATMMCRWSGARRAPLSRTFIPALLEDNPSLHFGDPAYRARIEALPVLERLRLLKGDWDSEPAKKDFYDGDRIVHLSARPAREDIKAICRAWDFASTTDGGDWTVGLLGAWLTSGRFVVLHVVRFQGSPDRVYQEFGRWSEADKRFDVRTVQVIPQDPGSAGKFVVSDFMRRFPHVPIATRRPDEDKASRFRPVSSRALVSEFSVVDDGSWDLDAYTNELEAFPLGNFDDQVDATSDAYAQVTEMPEEEDDSAMILPPTTR
jgi:predicted phage terminase large subunit-like protein